MSDILAEVEDAMRRERLEKIWKEHGKTILTGIAMVILGTGVGSAYRAWDFKVKAEGTDKLMALMEDTAFPENIRDAKLDMRADLQGITLLNAANAFMKQGKEEEALKLYTKVAEDSSIPSDIRGLGILMQVRLAPDAAANSNLVKQLETIWQDKNSPWQQSARIEAAGLAAASGNLKQAREHLAAVLETQGLPESIYGKARALDHIYALKEKMTPPASKPGTKTGS